MTIRISPIVSRICYRNKEYTLQEVVEYISDEGDDAFLGSEILLLRAQSTSKLREISEKHGLSMDQKLQRDSSEAGKSISDILGQYSNRQIGLILREASRRRILV
jgi:hypothetical protein